MQVVVHTVNQITKSNFSPSLSDRTIREMFHPFQYSVCSIVVLIQAQFKLKTSVHLQSGPGEMKVRSFISSGQYCTFWFIFDTRWLKVWCVCSNGVRFKIFFQKTEFITISCLFKNRINDTVSSSLHVLQIWYWF